MKPIKNWWNFIDDLWPAIAAFVFIGLLYYYVTH